MVESQLIKKVDSRDQGAHQPGFVKFLSKLKALTRNFAISGSFSRQNVLRTAASHACRLTDDQLGQDEDGWFCRSIPVGNAAEKGEGGCPANTMKWLPNGSETGVLERRRFDVIKT